MPVGDVSASAHCLPRLEGVCCMATALVGACGAAASDVALDALRRCVATPLASPRLRRRANTLRRR